MTDEGKRKLGVTNAENQISDAQKQFDRNKEDLATKTTQLAQDYKTQIDDTQKKIQQNIDFMQASGAWS